MILLSNKPKLLDLLGQGTAVITPNNRLSAALLIDYYQHSKQKTVDKPFCMPYNSMLSYCWQQLQLIAAEHKLPIMLNDAQIQHVWRTLIKSDSQITFSEGLLNAVMQAWEHCQQWQLSPDNHEFHYTPQTQHFQMWWQQFNQRLQKLNAITKHDLLSYSSTLELPLFAQPVIWYCFDDFTPQQISLQACLRNQGLDQYRYELPENTNSPQVFSASDTKEEYEQLLNWLDLKIAQGEQRIGVVIPELQHQSRHLSRLLHSHFDDALFNISLGQPLNEFPLIAHALCWLKLDPKHVTTHQATLLLQSPYLSHAKEEFLARAHYLQDSSLLQNQSVSLQALAQDIKPQAPQLAALLKQISPYPNEAAMQTWITLFQERLSMLGFPGDSGLNSENYQCLNRFITLFDELRQLSLITSQLSAYDALDALTQLVASTIFQAQKNPARINISGLLEASGCEFDSLWVMGLTDQCLPQKAQLSAFIPPHLQRDLLMPHSTPTRELQFARQTLQRLQHGSNATVFSYSKLQGDNPNLPCSLISIFPEYQALELPEPKDPNHLISMDETYLIPLIPEEHHSGGTALLANQAKCPFKAFAEHRLRAKPTPDRRDGLDTLERGQIIHKIMEVFWTAIQSQQHLFNLSPETLDQHIDDAIKTALSTLSNIGPEEFPELLREIEYIRLKRVVLACLDWEKQRTPFTVVALEQSYQIHLAGLDFKVRVDRLDAVGDKKWVIDYKSSLPGSKPWYEDRPKEPQLLLYALLDEAINALLFLQVKAGQVCSSGLSEEKHPVSGLSALKKDDTWSMHREHWQEQLSLLAEEFQQGHCMPKPADASICAYCDFQNLCRFQAQA